MGIPAVEDKLLQIAVSRILNAIYEPMFLPCSWAYRLGRNAREAVRTLTQELQFGCYGYIVEIDIKGFSTGSTMTSSWRCSSCGSRIGCFYG